MRFSTAYYLLIFYTIALCKPVLPLLKDTVAHIFWKAGHIATVHQHQGSHHAEDEIAGLFRQEKNNNNQSALIISEPVSIHLIVQSVFNYPRIFVEKQLNYSPRLFFISSPFLEKDYPPPRFC